MNLASNSPARKLRIVVLGYIVRCPIGGMTWHHLQYVMGLAQLGHDVYFIEDSGDDSWACYDPVRNVSDPDPTYGLAFVTRTFAAVNLARRWAYHDALASQWHGPAAGLVDELSNNADLLLNLSGSNILRPWAMRIPRRVYVDTDPVFTQLRHLSNPSRRERALQHTHFVSFGENFGKSDCLIPDDGIIWQPTRQPIVLGAWPVLPPPDSGRFTTVMQWDKSIQDAPMAYQGVEYGRKADSFSPYFDLPRQTETTLELALGGNDAPRKELRDCGWSTCNPHSVAGDPWAYQHYIQQSMAEFSVAKQGYVFARSGWFSERSACYLASGRPVLVQETGFSDWLPTGCGVIGFQNRDEALGGLREISDHYETHCEAARRIAQEWFDASKVLSHLIDVSLSRAAGEKAATGVRS
ncbi:MAG: hypothetical protein ACR2PS_02825 [Pseudomonadales bacterium]